jgi:hypothetical protein
MQKKEEAQKRMELEAEHLKLLEASKWVSKGKEGEKWH